MVRYLIAYLINQKQPAKIWLPGDEVQPQFDDEADKNLRETIKAELEQGVKWVKDGRSGDINSQLEG